MKPVSPYGETMSVIIKTPLAALKPLRTPKYPLAFIRLNNLLLNKTLGFSFALSPERLAHIRLLPCDFKLQMKCPLGLTISLGNTTAGLWLSSWPQTDKLEQLVPANMLGKLPENLAISVVESIQANLLRQAETALQLNINIQSLYAEPRTPLYTLPLGFELQEISSENNEIVRSTTGLLVIDPQLYPHLQERLRAWPSNENEDWDEHLTRIHFELSRQQFNMQEINQLDVSDILLLSQTDFQDSGHIRIRLDSGDHCEATFNSTNKTALTITTGWNSMSDNEQKANINHIAHLPVQLSFDLGEKTMTFNEVRQLQPGYILELSGSLPEIVQIRSQNRLIGSGELVEINGRVGVRILKLFGKKAKGS